VILERRGNEVSVGVARDDACGMATKTVAYSGALAELPALVIGFGGAHFETCPAHYGAGRVADLRLRLLENPARCPAGAEVCGRDTQQPTCVDTRRSSEHCGSCDDACSANEVCAGGRCACSMAPGILVCDGVCIDSTTAKDHCGACDRACKRNCTSGICDVRGDCASPTPLPPEGGTFPVDFAHQNPDLVALCGVRVYNEEVFSWTPSESGHATLEVRSPFSLAIFSVTDDPACSGWITCGDKFTSAGGRPIVLPVAAGVTYRIAVGIYVGDHANSTGELAIQVQP
jgi:hypothetical protein